LASQVPLTLAGERTSSFSSFLSLPQTNVDQSTRLPSAQDERETDRTPETL